MKAFNPFSISGYKGAAYFCDREEETERLVKYTLNQVSVTLFAYRRLGKTGLVKHAFNRLSSSKESICIYVDILGTIGLKDFTNQLATSIYNAFPPNKSIGKKIINVILSLRPTITFDALTGTPNISINTQNTEQQVATLNQLFAFLDQQKKQITIAIDEFQQILTYPEKNIEALLRTQMQQLNNTTFIFCGSNQKMMHEIFNSAKRPFFASCTPMYLDFIEEEKYSRFIKSLFEKNKRTISVEALTFICDWTRRHTFYTQYFCNSLFSRNHKINGLEEARETAVEILKIQENSFYQYRNLLTSTQWDVLKGIAKAGQLFRPNSKDFINENRLGSPSAVNRAIEGLLNKEMIFYNSAVERPYYEVYNKFLMRWMEGK